MINKKAVNNILSGWLNSQPEMAKLVQLRTDIVQYVLSQAILVLGEEEKMFLDSIKIGDEWRVKEQYSLDSYFFGALGRLFPEEFPITDSPSRWFSTTSSTMSGLKLIPGSSSYFYYFGIKAPADYPYKFVPSLITYYQLGCNRDIFHKQIEEFIERYPVSWEGLKSILLQYYSIGSKLSKKTEALFDMLCDCDLSLNILSKHYPELYKFK